MVHVHTWNSIVGVLTMIRHCARITSTVIGKLCHIEYVVEQQNMILPTPGLEYKYNCKPCKIIMEVWD